MSDRRSKIVSIHPYFQNALASFIENNGYDPDNPYASSTSPTKNQNHISIHPFFQSAIEQFQKNLEETEKHGVPGSQSGNNLNTGLVRSGSLTSNSGMQQSDGNTAYGHGGVNPLGLMLQNVTSHTVAPMTEEITPDNIDIFLGKLNF